MGQHSSSSAGSSMDISSPRSVLPRCETPQQDLYAMSQIICTLIAVNNVMCPWYADQADHNRHA